MKSSGCETAGSGGSNAPFNGGSNTDCNSEGLNILATYLELLLGAHLILVVLVGALVHRQNITTGWDAFHLEGTSIVGRIFVLRGEVLLIFRSELHHGALGWAIRTDDVTRNLRCLYASQRQVGLRLFSGF